MLDEDRYDQVIHSKDELYKSTAYFLVELENTWEKVSENGDYMALVNDAMNAILETIVLLNHDDYPIAVNYYRDGREWYNKHGMKILSLGV